MNFVENIFDVIVFGTILASFFGIKRPFFSGIAGLVILPLLYHWFDPGNLTTLIVLVPVGLILGFLAGFVLSILLSGLKGKGHNTGPSYMGGFGGGRGGAPPGGIILSDEERKRLK